MQKKQSTCVLIKKGDISTLNGGSLKLVDKFNYLGSSISSTENDINKWLAKAWTVIDRLSIIWKSNLSNKMQFFPSSSWVNSTIWMHHMDAKCIEKKIDGNCTRMPWVILNKSWKQHPTKQQLYGHLPPISKTIQIRQKRHAGHYWKSKKEFISAILLWTPSHRHTSVGQLTRTYLQQLGMNRGFCQEDLSEVMDDRDEWQERIREIHTGSMTWWWWWYIFLHLFFLWGLGFIFQVVSNIRLSHKV